VTPGALMEKNEKSFMHALCLGQIEEDLIVPFPKIDQEEAELLRGVVDALASNFKDRDDEYRKWDREGELPESVLEEMKSLGLFSLIIPEEFGGMGMNSSAYSRTLQEIAKYNASIAITAGAHSSIGMRALKLYGTEEQRNLFYQKLATGEMIAAFCLTEPGAGSDAAAIKTKAVRDGDYWIINGSKLWITNGGIAGFYTVFARTDGPEGQITAFIVTRDMEGVSTGPHEDKMGIRASNTTTVMLDNVRVPHSYVLGEVGKGFKVAMNVLNSGRTGLGGGCVGGMKRLIEMTTKQCKERHQFGKPISDYGLIKQKIGNMVVDCYATESVVSMVSGIVDRGSTEYAIEAAISKVFATECLWRASDEALQAAGGNGFMCEFPYERFMRDSRINRIFEGTNDILRLFIALTGMNDVGNKLTDLSKSLEGIFNDPIKGFGTLSEYAIRRVSQETGVGASSFTKLDPSLKPYSDRFESGVRDLAKASDKILRKHGKNIIGKQFATKRMADIMIDLFVLASVLSRVDSSIREKGIEEAKKEVEILEVFSGQVQRRIRSNLELIDENDDELVKSLANHALDQEKYSWDTI
jgi:acyl-CoA dehydrogenase family protein 9